MRTVYGVAGGSVIAGVVASIAGCEGRVLELGGPGVGASTSTGVSTSTGASTSTDSYGGIVGAAACTLHPSPAADAGGTPARRSPRSWGRGRDTRRRRTT